MADKFTYTTDIKEGDSVTGYLSRYHWPVKLHGLMAAMPYNKPFQKLEFPVNAALEQDVKFTIPVATPDKLEFEKSIGKLEAEVKRHKKNARKIVENCIDRKDSCAPQYVFDYTVKEAESLDRKINELRQAFSKKKGNLEATVKALQSDIRTIEKSFQANIPKIIKHYAFVKGIEKVMPG